MAKVKMSKDEQRFLPVSDLVHIVPDEYIIGTGCPMPIFTATAVLEQRGPPIPTSWVEKIDPGTAAAPTPAFEFTLPAGRPDQKTELRGLRVHGV
jgi:hypothetical protein